MTAALPREVVIASTGTANLASVSAALRRAGCTPIVTDDPSRVRDASRVVLPGVGSFAAAMDRLHATGLDDAIAARVRTNRSTLAICLGMQVLADASDESPGVPGLGLVHARAERFPDSAVRVPLMGWNNVRLAADPDASGALGSVYFANSYRLRAAPDGWDCAWAEHAGPFVAAMQRGRIVACQFHPELSADVGAGIIARWSAAPEAEPNPRILVPTRSPARPRTPPGATRRVIACLDVRDGRVVKGVRFQLLRDAGDPAQLAREYERQGADEIVLLDISATTESRATAAETVERVRSAVGIAVTAGGGVRTADDVGRLLAAGADKAVLNSAAVARETLIRECADRFGAQCVVVAIDAARRTTPPPPGHSDWQVVVRSGAVRTELDAPDWAARAAALGAGELLVTSWDRDGTGLGYDIPLLRAVAGRVRVPVVASGGARNPDDLAEALLAGADAALAAGMFHDGRCTIADAKARLARSGLEVRP